VRIGHILRKKNIHTDEPAEHMDTKILETIIALDNGQMLLPGLRVDAFIMGLLAQPHPPCPSC
jgi:hypothetical protein